jgi:nucleoid DNA-binding protein
MDDIISILAAKYNLDQEVVERLIRSEFEFVANTIESGQFDSVHLHFLGKFAVKPNRLKQLHHEDTE